MHEDGLRRELVRELGGEVAVEREELRRGLEGMQHGTAEDARDRVRPELERGNDAEVAAAPAKRPEQVGIGVLARGDHLAGRKHDFGGEKVVDGHPVLAHQPGDPPAEGEARDPGERDDAARGREPKGGGGTVELTDPDAGLRADGPSRRVDVDALHEREVDHQPPVRDRLAGDVVAAAADRDLEALLPAEVHSVHDVRRVQTLRYHRRTIVDQAVVNAPGLVVAGITRNEDRPGERLPEQLDGVGCRRARHH